MRFKQYYFLANKTFLSKKMVLSHNIGFANSQILVSFSQQLLCYNRYAIFQLNYMYAPYK